MGGRGDGNGEGTVNENKVTWPRMQLLKNLPVYSGVVLPFKSCTLTLQLRLHVPMHGSACALKLTLVNKANSQHS